MVWACFGHPFEQPVGRDRFGKQLCEGRGRAIDFASFEAQPSTPWECESGDDFGRGSVH